MSLGQIHWCSSQARCMVRKQNIELSISQGRLRRSWCVHREPNTAFNKVWHNIYLLTSQHGPMFGSTVDNHHQLAGSHCKISLIAYCLVTTICSQIKQIAGNTCIMGKSIHLETSLDRRGRRGLDLQWSHVGVASDWSWRLLHAPPCQ